MTSRIRGHRLNYPSLMGAYLAINAIPDAYILVDGPDCALYKAHFIHGRHDLNSTLLDIDGRHRVCFTNVCAQSVTKDHNELIFRRLRILEDMDEPAIVLLTSLPGCSITGIDYEHLMRSAGMFMKKDSLAIPPTSLVGDWLDGYGATMRALAKHVDLSGGEPAPENAAIVGYMMDRNEGDHIGNLKELKRILGVLGLNLVSTWFGGDSYKDLSKVKNAGLIISLPYGREAARDLAKKTGAKLVETSVPFGMGYTIRWVRQIAAATGKAGEAEALIAREKSAILKRLEWIVPYLFLHKKASFIGDPYLMEGFLDICDDMGMSVRDCFVMSRERRDEAAVERKVSPLTVFEPDIYHPDVNHFLGSPTELVVTSTNEIVRVIRWHEVSIVELGFPSYFRHALTDAPFLGFAGFLSFVERMADALSNMRRRILLGGQSDNDKDDDNEPDRRDMLAVDGRAEEGAEPAARAVGKGSE